VFAEEDIDEGTKLLEKMANGALQNNAAFIEEYQSVMSSLQHDMRFAETLKNRKTIMGFVMDTDMIKGSLPPAITKLDDNNLGQLQLNKPTGYTSNLELFQKSAYGGSVFDNPLLDDDSVFRRVPLLQVYGNQLYRNARSTGSIWIVSCTPVKTRRAMTGTAALPILPSNAGFVCNQQMLVDR